MSVSNGARILLHMGVHKTGSTTLQTSFAHHRARLREAGIAYLGPAGPYPHLYSAFLADPMRFEWNRHHHLSVDEIRDRDRAALDKLAEPLSWYRDHGRTVILSNEWLPLLQPGEMAALRDFLSQFGRVEAAYFYRNLHDWLSSDTQEMAKAGLATRPTPFATALARVHQLPLRIAEVFGRDRTTFFRFEDAIGPGICNSFLTDFGLPSLTALGGTEIVANASVSGPAVEALLSYNATHPLGSSGRDPGEVVRRKALPGDKYRAPPLRPEDVTAYSVARQEVRDRLGLRLDPPGALPQHRPSVSARLRRRARRVARRLTGLAG